MIGFWLRVPPSSLPGGTRANHYAGVSYLPRRFRATGDRSVGESISPLLASRGAHLAGNRLVLQHADCHSAVLRLAFLGLRVAHLLALAHRARSQHPRHRNLALLDQDIGHVLSAILAEGLVHLRVSGLGCEALDLDHVTV